MPSLVRLSDGTVVTPSVASDTVPSVLHSVAAQVTAIDGGKMDCWQKLPDGSCAGVAAGELRQRLANPADGRLGELAGREPGDRRTCSGCAVTRTLTVVVRVACSPAGGGVL
jgi:hypothetical protein